MNWTDEQLTRLAERIVRQSDYSTGVCPADHLLVDYEAGALTAQTRCAEIARVLEWSLPPSCGDAGAVRAALWASGRTPGMYSMVDVLGV